MNKQTVLVDLKRIPKLLIGFLFVALGNLFSKKSDLGMLPWGVFHDGLSNLTGITFGVIIQVVGLIVLALSIIFVKVKPGIGTLLNILFIGLMYDFINSLKIVVETDSIMIRSIYLVLGVICSGFGTALYVSCKLGSGPRDGLFIGLSLITKLSVKYTKPIIDVTVLIIGIILHGSFGIGTAVNAFLSGYIINFFFKRLKYDPKTAKQRKFTDYVSTEPVNSLKRRS